MSRRHQAGISMLELLIGMLLAMFAVMAMLSLSRTTSRVTALSRLGVQTDAQLATGLLAADKLLAQAGYFAVTASGSVPAPRYPDDLRLLQNATLGGSAQALLLAPASGTLVAQAGQGQALLWRSRDASGVFRYDGLYAPASGGLWRIHGSSMDWAGWEQAEQLLGAPPRGHDSLASAGVASFAVSRAAGGCQPFGVGSSASGGVYTVRISALAYSAGQRVDSHTCLMNFQ